MLIIHYFLHCRRILTAIEARAIDVNATYKADIAGQTPPPARASRRLTSLRRDRLHADASGQVQAPAFGSPFFAARRRRDTARRDD